MSQIYCHVIILRITYLFVIGLHGNWIWLLTIGSCTAMFTYLQEQHTRHIKAHTKIQFFTHLWRDDLSEGVLWWLYAEYGERLHRWAELPHLYVRSHKLRQDVHHTRYVHVLVERTWLRGRAPDLDFYINSDIKWQSRIRRHWIKMLYIHNSFWLNVPLCNIFVCSIYHVQYFYIFLVTCIF